MRKFKKYICAFAAAMVVSGATSAAVTAQETEVQMSEDGELETEDKTQETEVQLSEDMELETEGKAQEDRNVELETAAQETERLDAQAEALQVDLADGEYAISVDMTGGSGKASITSPTVMTIRDGRAYATIVWSSSYYDYMIVGSEKYLNQAEEDSNSTFDIPITVFDSEMAVLADTTAMGTPHEIEYQLTFYSDSVGSKDELPQEAAKKVVVIALIIIIGGGILNYFVQKKRRV